MRSIITIIALSFSLLSFASPRIRVIDRDIYLGTIYMEDRDAAFEIRYTNTGDSPLYLVKVQTFCPCVKDTFSVEALSPGDTASIKVLYSPLHTGHESQGLRIYYNSDDPEMSETVFFYADVAERRDQEEEESVKSN